MFKNRLFEGIFDRGHLTSLRISFNSSSDFMKDKVLS